MAAILMRMFEHNHWANLRTLQACSDLTDEQLDATVAGTGGTIRHLLMHIAGAEQRYIARLKEREPSYSERNGWPGNERLREELDESGRLLIALAAAADTDEILRGEFQGRPYVLPASVLYVQAINHATEHRSQIATILTQQSIEPPGVDGWDWSRAQEGTG